MVGVGRQGAGRWDWARRGVGRCAAALRWGWGWAGAWVPLARLPREVVELNWPGASLLSAGLPSDDDDEDKKSRSTITTTDPLATMLTSTLSNLGRS